MKEPSHTARASIIWMHGLGADASDMQGLAAQMDWSATAVRHIFLNAPQRSVTINQGMLMPAWYDITGTQLTDREDENGIMASAQTISALIHDQIQQSIAPENIYLAGFSQGAAMALFSGLREKNALGGIIALSGYLPLAATLKPLQCHSTPMFIAAGRFDPVVLPQWTQASENWLRQQGYEQLSSYRYPMEHSICLEEIRDLQNWFNPLFSRSTR
ncbi:MAG: carboxylesterase [Legionellaceae bacterium]|nr:carboxylesterase [Legionellaceae bacterium]